jgi:hypothetical protein
MDCERSFVPSNRRPCLKSSSFLRPVQALLLDNLFRAGVLADRCYQGQCWTGPATHGSGMNFPQTPKNPEIPARKLNSRENTGKILLE